MSARVDAALLDAQARGEARRHVVVRLSPGSAPELRVPGLAVEHRLASVPALTGVLSLSELSAAAATPGVEEIELDQEAHAS